MTENIPSSNQDQNIQDLLKTVSEITDPDFIKFGQHVREFEAKLFAVFPDGQRVELNIPAPQECNG
ncbi:MAG: hypothetical protein WC736_09855 [Gallionella sp.]|jgi:hypothetical protein